jgi:hypothetical protein
MTCCGDCHAGSPAGAAGVPCRQPGARAGHLHPPGDLQLVAAEGDGAHRHAVGQRLLGGDHAAVGDGAQAAVQDQPVRQEPLEARVGWHPHRWRVAGGQGGDHGHGLIGQRLQHDLDQAVVVLELGRGGDQHDRPVQPLQPAWGRRRGHAGASPPPPRPACAARPGGRGGEAPRGSGSGGTGAHVRAWCRRGSGPSAASCEGSEQLDQASSVWRRLRCRSWRSSFQVSTSVTAISWASRRARRAPRSPLRVGANTRSHQPAW